MREKQGRIRSFLAKLGPGLITGAADDDPAGIATYSQAGAMFGYSQLWVMLFSFPFMTAVQEMCGRIGLVTGNGLAGVIKRHYSQSIVSVMVALLLIANTVNIGADLGAMAAALQLFLPISFWNLLIGITVFTLILQVFVPYPTYATFLKYAAFSLVAYFIAAFAVTQDWPRILHDTFIPHITLSREYILNIAALLGTTISPYLFFWQADEEVEEEIEKHRIRDLGSGKPRVYAHDFRDLRFDTAIGMLVSNVIAFFVIMTVASTIGASGDHHISSAAEAASALQPIAGSFATILFTIGIVGTGLLAVPVLAGSVGYAVAEAVGWKAGLGKKFGQARGFYVVIIAATVVGLLVNATSLDPITVLYYSAILNALLAPPLLVMILFITNNRRILGSHTNGSVANLFGIAIALIMSLVGVATIVTLFV